jgi:hypothetical protein
LVDFYVDDRRADFFYGRGYGAGVGVEERGVGICWRAVAGKDRIREFVEGNEIGTESAALHDEIDEDRCKLDSGKGGQGARACQQGGATFRKKCEGRKLALTVLREFSIALEKVDSPNNCGVRAQ